MAGLYGAGSTLARMTRMLVLVAMILILTSCRATPPVEDSGPDLSTYPPPTTEPYDPCLPVAPGSIDALRDGVQAIEAGNDVGAVAAIRSGAEWFVAAEIIGAGLSDTVGVWVTMHDPTNPDTSNAYNSVDPTAAIFSFYVRSPKYDVTDPRVDEVKACL